MSRRAVMDPKGATSWPLGEYRSAKHGFLMSRRAVPKANTAVRSTEVS